MDRAPTTSATALRLFAKALEDLGIDWESILRSCGIDTAQLADPEARIPQDRFDRVWIAARDFTGDLSIGLHAGERVTPRAVNIFGYLMLSSATLRDGLRRVALYQHVLTSEPWLAIDETESIVRIRIGIEHADAELRAIHAEYVAPLILNILSWVSDTQVTPVEAHFGHEPRTEPSEYARVLRCPVKFGAPRNELVLREGTLDRPSVHSNPRFAQLHEAFAIELLAREGATDIRARVRRALAERLETGPTDIPSIARPLGMSTRSLQRRLAEGGTSFRETLETLRRDLALEHLQQRGAPIAEVAYLTGFSEVSAFTRAVRRWFDRTPSELRRKPTSPSGSLGLDSHPRSKPREEDLGSRSD